MPRVAVQAWLPSHEPSGARTRLLGLLRGLADVEQARGVELLALTSKQEPPDPALHDVVAPLPRARVVPVDIPPGPTLGRARAEARLLPRLLDELAVDLLDLQSLPVPRLDVPVVWTLHDLRDAGTWARGWRRFALGPALRQARRRVARVIVPSPIVASALARSWGPGAAVDVVPAGIEGRASGPARERSGFLSIGRPEPRKALPFLIEAFAAALPRSPDLGQLVFVGAGAARGWQELGRLAARLGVASEVQFAGPVDDTALADLAAGVRALVFPSRLEGFGMPVLEAMCHGTPCLVAEGGATAWLAGDGGLPLPPDVGAWCQALLRLQSDRSTWQRLSAAGGWLASWQRALAVEAREARGRG